MGMVSDPDVASDRSLVHSDDAASSRGQASCGRSHPGIQKCSVGSEMSASVWGGASHDEAATMLSKDEKADCMPRTAMMRDDEGAAANTQTMGISWLRGIEAELPDLSVHHNPESIDACKEGWLEGEVARHHQRLLSTNLPSMADGLLLGECEVCPDDYPGYISILNDDSTSLLGACG